VWVSTALATASDSRDGVVASTFPRVQVKYRLGGYARGGSGVESVDHHKACNFVPRAFGTIARRHPLDSG